MIKSKTKNEKRKKLIQARIEKKEAKRDIRRRKKAGKITKEEAKEFKEQTKTTHDEETKAIKQEGNDRKQIEKMKKMNKGGNMTIPNYLVGGQVKLDKMGDGDGELTGNDFKIINKKKKDNKKAENGMKVKKYNEGGMPNKDGGNISLSDAKKIAAKHNVNLEDLGKNVTKTIEGGITGDEFLKMLDKYKLLMKRRNLDFLTEQGKKMQKGEDGMKVKNYDHGGVHKKAAQGILIMLKKKSDKKKKK